MLQTPGRSNQLPKLANNDVKTAPQMCASGVREHHPGLSSNHSHPYLLMYSLHIPLFPLFLHVVTYLDGFDSWLFPFLKVLNY